MTTNPDNQQSAKPRKKQGTNFPPIVNVPKGAIEQPDNELEILCEKYDWPYPKDIDTLLQYVRGWEHDNNLKSIPINTAIEYLLAWRDKARIDELTMIGYKNGKPYSLYTKSGKLLTLEERIAELKGGNVTNSLTTVQLREEIRKLYGVKKSHYINFEPRLEQLMSLVKDHDEYIIGPDLSIKLPSGNIDPRKEAINEEKVAARNRAGGY